MKHLSRISLCGAIAVVLTVLFVSLLIKLGGDDWKENLNLTMWTERLLDSIRRQQELEAQGIPILRRTFEKRRIVHELIAHRLNLWQAVDEFRELNEEVRQAQPPEVPRALLPDDDDQTMCRNVIVWVRAELSNDPERANQLTGELEREMSRHSWQHN